MKFWCVGGLSPVEQKFYYKDYETKYREDIDDEDQAPARKGIWAYIYPYVSLSDLPSLSTDPIFEENRPFKKYTLSLEDKIKRLVHEKPRIFEHDGPVWCHFVKEAEQLGINGEKRANYWIKVSTQDLPKLIKKFFANQKTTLLKSKDVKTKEQLMHGEISLKKFIRDPRHFEVFIEKPQTGKVEQKQRKLTYRPQVELEENDDIPTIEELEKREDKPQKLWCKKPQLKHQRSYYVAVVRKDKGDSLVIEDSLKPYVSSVVEDKEEYTSSIMKVFFKPQYKLTMFYEDHNPTFYLLDLVAQKIIGKIKETQSFDLSFRFRGTQKSYVPIIVRLALDVFDEEQSLIVTERQKQKEREQLQKEREKLTEKEKNEKLDELESLVAKLLMLIKVS